MYYWKCTYPIPIVFDKSSHFFSPSLFLIFNLLILFFLFFLFLLFFFLFPFLFFFFFFFHLKHCFSFLDHYLNLILVRRIYIEYCKKKKILPKYYVDSTEDQKVPKSSYELIRGEKWVHALLLSTVITQCWALRNPRNLKTLENPKHFLINSSDKSCDFRVFWIDVNVRRYQLPWKIR